MKKIVFYLMLITMLSCSSGNNIEVDSKLIGLWERSFDIGVGEIAGLTDENYEHVSQYVFNFDQSFNHASFIRNIQSGDILAYSQRYVGDYQIDGNRLNLSFDYWGATPLDDQFSNLQSLDELILISENEKWSFSYSIIKNNELQFDFDPCAPFENCFDGVTLFRKQ